MKICIKCNIEKEDIYFVKERNCCKDCKYKEQKNKYYKNKENLKASPDELRKCPKCNKYYTNINFLPYDKKCRDCYKEYKRKLWTNKNPPKKKIDISFNKSCTKCNEKLPLTEFRYYVNKKKINIYRNKCKICEKDENRKYRQSVIGKDKTSKWMTENINKYKKTKKIWKENNKSIINAKKRERLKTDFIFKLRTQISSRLAKTLKKIHKTKSKSTLKYINSTLDYVKKWLEFCFANEMTIENHGQLWHIDHVIPVAKFNFNDDKDIELCFSWFNLMPLLKEENLIKQDKIDKEQIIKHLQNLKDFGVNPHEYIQLCATHLDAGNP